MRTRPSKSSRRVVIAAVVLALAMGVAAVVLLCVFTKGVVPGAQTDQWGVRAGPLVADNANYMVGRGIADATGPVVEINMMGYVKGDQNTQGIHLRLFSRAFIVEDPDTDTRVVYVCLDAAMIPQLLKIRVVAALLSRYGDTYSDANVLLAATHTHSGPGAYMQYVVYQASSLGFYEPSLQALVDGVVESIVMAHDSMVPGKLYLGRGHLDDAGINRSPTAYLLNPQPERMSYPDGDTDKVMMVLKMTDAEDRPLGMINWFPVHATSMEHSNTLISSDNKGYAAILVEEYMDPGTFPGKGSFVAAFAQTNHGDVSPNLDGPRCQDTGDQCNADNTCQDGTVTNCVATGPGEDMFESTRMIAERLADKAKDIFAAPGTQLFGPVDFRLRYVDMTNVPTTHENQTVHTCKPALGFSTAAGTTDGPGEFDFVQGDTSGNQMWQIVRNLISTPSNELKACHAPKPILFPTGETDFPYPWQPDIVDYQVFRLGQLIIGGVPGELTTMAGRRIRSKILEELWTEGFPNDMEVVVNGLANSYMNYVTTYEEYQLQRYEAASTSYGPHTLAAMTDILVNMTAAIAKNLPVATGLPPPDLSKQQLCFITPVVMDTAEGLKKFGSVKQNVQKSYRPEETATVSFRAGNPRNSDSRNTTFLAVERLGANDTWYPIRSEAHWDTKFRWQRTNPVLGQSLVHLSWTIPGDQDPGTYRFTHNGHYKQLFAGGVKPYSGVSDPFQIHTSH